MSGVRRLYLDRAIGETRGVVTLDHKPERLFIARDGEEPCQRAGARLVARVSRIERGLGTAFLQMPGGPDAVTPLTAGLVEGATIEVEVAAEPRAGKGAVVRMAGVAEGAPRLLAEGPSVAARLAQYASGAVVEGPEARAVADEAQAEVLAIEHPLPGGGSIAIETTRALTAVDIDQGERGGGDARRAARQANLAAIAMAARLLRLKGLGGLVVFDLIGKGHDGPGLSAVAKAAFAPDGPQVSIGPISRFGLFELALPHGARGALEILTADEGRASSLTIALDMIRAVEREWRANPGSRLAALTSPQVARAAAPLLSGLIERFGVVCDLGVREGLIVPYEVVAR